VQTQIWNANIENPIQILAEFMEKAKLVYRADVAKCQHRLVSGYGLYTKVQGNPNTLQYGKKFRRRQKTFSELIHFTQHTRDLQALTKHLFIYNFDTHFSQVTIRFLRNSSSE
jgi:hypothetical protein